MPNHSGQQLTVESYDRYLWSIRAAAKLAADWIERVYYRRMCHLADDGREK
jgi:hypothetical protein